MRHNKKFNHLSRTHSHRDALLSNMTASLILHKRIFTTLAKAKALRMYAEPLLNRGKEYNMQNWRLVFSRLNHKEAVKELFTEVGPKIANRAGGYTRILKTGNRLGDNAKMCFIELVDYNEAMLKDSAAAGKGKKTRRSRGKKAEAPAAEAPAAEAPSAEAPAAE
ncbi:MAG: 50S ribosomal protein L17 [Muribaculaceae bacterium]|nr:50S ribosomal protein L17 [Muribaculaceae bacterium]